LHKLLEGNHFEGTVRVIGGMMEKTEAGKLAVPPISRYRRSRRGRQCASRPSPLFA
jgi:hypothetical protein